MKRDRIFVILSILSCGACLGCFMTFVPKGWMPPFFFLAINVIAIVYQYFYSITEKKTKLTEMISVKVIALALTIFVSPMLYVIFLVLDVTIFLIHISPLQLSEKK